MLFVGLGLKVIKKITLSQLSMKFILLINVKMPFMSRINTTYGFKARKGFIFRYISFFEKLKFCAQLS